MVDYSYGFSGFSAEFGRLRRSRGCLHVEDYRYANLCSAFGCVYGKPERLALGTSCMGSSTFICKTVFDLHLSYVACSVLRKRSIGCTLISEIRFTFVAGVQGNSLDVLASACMIISGTLMDSLCITNVSSRHSRVSSKLLFE